jgi:hypothetical protein
MPAIRTKVGSFNPKGFSLLTGIPGLTYRSGWKSRPELGLVLLVIGGLALVGINLLKIVWYLLSIIIQFIIHLFKKS